MNEIHRTGCCIVCGEPVFEIREHYKTGHMQGYPKKIGGPFAFARRAEIFLMDGSTTDWTVCADCVPEIDLQLPRLWHKILRTFVFMQEHALERGIRPYTSQQAMEFNHSMRELAVNRPLGVRNVRNWADLLNA